MGDGGGNPCKRVTVRKINFSLLVSLTITFLMLQLNVQRSEASVVDLARKSIIAQMEQAWNAIKAFDRTNKTPEVLLKMVGQNIKNIPVEVGKVEKEMLIYEYDEALKSLSKVKNTSVAWRDKWSEIAVLTSPVDIIYGHFKIFPEMPDAFAPGSGALDFDANSLTELILKPLYKADANKDTLTLKFLVDNAHSAAVSHTRGRKNAFTLLSNHIDEALQQSYWCLWNAKTPQRLVYGLFTSLSLLDLKEFTLLNFAYMLRYALNGTDPGNELALTKDSLNIRFAEKAINAKRALEKASSAYWRCDPIKYEKGKTYEEFQELLQGYIENEQNMHHTGSCKQSCGEYNFVKAYCPYPDQDNCRKQRYCTGDLLECKFIAADSKVCTDDAPRRYGWIQYKKGPTFGNTSGKCVKDIVTRDSFWRFLYHCSNCFCLCDDSNSPTTTRHISLVPITSDVASGRIVTGVRFAMKEGVLHIQIQQGEPTTEGLVVDESTVWKDLASVDKNDKTQAVMMEYTQRALDLDDLLVPQHHVVTGVRFRKLGTHVNLELQGTQINPDTGKLIPDTSHWISNDNTPESEAEGIPPREQLILEDPDVPTKTLHPSVPDSVHDQYVQFGASSPSKDASQTTIPFIDIQEVRPKPPVWLKGIGIYHKGQWGYGGFIAPRIFTHSAADYIQLDEP